MQVAADLLTTLFQNKINTFYTIERKRKNSPPLSPLQISFSGLLQPCITRLSILKVSQIDIAGWPRGFFFFYPGVYNSNWCKIS